MLGPKIENLLKPKINYYESREPNYFPGIFQITEQNSNFEKIIKEMKANTKKKLSFKTCSNPNCPKPFSGILNCNECKSCGAKYCNKCIKQCQKCNDNICVFCVTIKYGNFEDVELCPICVLN